ncbi:MAG TPA: heavy metal translocating P-type ATPase [Herbaspirillum sp.]|nr:heavy metal translocating P-type ATPase [Herbaspirillum sp.]
MPHCSHHNHTHEHIRQHDADDIEPAALKNVQKAVFFIQNMDCPTEEKLIRTRLAGMEGIAAMQFNLIQRELTVQHRLTSIAPIVAALSALDMLPRIKSDTLSAGSDAADRLARAMPKRKWRRVGIAAIAALAAEAVAWNSGNDGSPTVIALALFAIATGGGATLRKGWIALRHLSLNMNFLMSLAVIGAILIGQWPEAAVVIVLFTLAEMIESLSLDHARNTIAGLMAMSPDQATVLRDGVWTSIAAGQVAVDAEVRVKPGERIPLDGIIMQGQPTIDQAPITGESIPVVKTGGDQVFAGTINGNTAFDYRVTAVQGESTLARIIHSVQQAQGRRAPTQRLVDRFARYYIPAIVALAALVALAPPLLLGVDFYPWFYQALVLLVIACPCALVISTPVTIVSGLAAAARHGILIKGGIYLEQGRRLEAIAFDKTGTITHGKPVVTDTQVLSQDAAATLLQQAASLALRSDHPVSIAIAAHWQAQQTGAATDIADFEALPGRGVKGRIGGDACYLGNHRLVHDMGMCNPALEERLQILEKQGKTVTILCRDGRAQLLLAVADTVRDSSRDAIAQLRRSGISVTILTGDNPRVARAIANVIGIDDARGDQLPADKLDAIDGMIEQHGYVGMVGDGINDAPALARAHIGFAMGAAGTDTALETADVAIMNDDLRRIPDFIRLSQKTHGVLMQNITIALGIKALFLGLALTGASSLWMAVFADMGASLIVMFNGLRLMRSP